MRYDGSAPNAGHGYQVHVGPTLSDARGWVRIRSTDPDEYPSIRFNYLSTEQDRREWVEAIRCTRRILGQPALQPFRGEEIAPGSEIQSDEAILDFIAREEKVPITQAAPVEWAPTLTRLRILNCVCTVLRTSSCGRIGHALSHKWQYRCAGIDDRRKSGRPDSWQHSSRPHQRTFISIGPPNDSEEHAYQWTVDRRAV